MKNAQKYINSLFLMIYALRKLPQEKKYWCILKYFKIKVMERQTSF